MLRSAQKELAGTTVFGKWHEVGWPALASSLALWSAFPPLGWSSLVWIAPLGLLWLVDRPQSPGAKGYLVLWLAGCAFWLAILHGIRLAYWPLIFGWLALSLYLAVYFPLFVGAARIFRHRWQWPLVFAAPAAWTAMELWRSYLLTGYAASTLAHTQYRNPLVIQLADQLGGYGVSFVILAVAVAIYRLVESSRTRRAPTSWLDLATGGSLLALLLGYGAWRLDQGDRLVAQRPALLHVALIQENTPSQFDADPEKLEVAWTKYADTTAAALRQARSLPGTSSVTEGRSDTTGRVDLIVWPESTFSAMIPWIEDHIVEEVPQEMRDLNYDREAIRQQVAHLQEKFAFKVQALHRSLRTAQSSAVTAGEIPDSTRLPHLLVGNDAMVIEDHRVARYNAALLIDPVGSVTARYDKVHLVMFGEYIPLGWMLKFLGDAFGLASATHGQMPRALEVNGVTLAPSICFESMLPQFMAWQLRSLKQQGNDPDLLVTITNDSWFRGSSMLDHHLACEVLAAVEMRRPFLVAANTGLSASIAGSGRILEQTERLKPAFILAQPRADSRWGLTQMWGDLPAWCLAIVTLLALLQVGAACRGNLWTIRTSQR